MYSALAAEVEDSTDAQTGLNGELLSQLNSSEKLIVCGQALSHCVNFTVRDLVDYWTKDTSIINILSDGAASVNGYQENGELFLKEMSDAGCTITTIDEVFSN